MKRLPFFRPAGHDVQVAGCALVEHDPLADTEVVETVEAESGIAVERAVGQPFDDDRHGQDRLAVEHVGAEERVIVDVRVRAKASAQVRGRERVARGGRFSRLPAMATISTGASVAAISRTRNSPPAARR